jgi:hypothetical protein
MRTQHAALGVSGNQATNLLRRHAASGSHSLYLILRRRWADMRVQSAGRSCHQINWNWNTVFGVGCPERGNALPDGLGQIGIRRPEIGTVRRRRIVREGSRRRRPAPEILWVFKGLSDQ